MPRVLAAAKLCSHDATSYLAIIQRVWLWLENRSDRSLSAVLLDVASPHPQLLPFDGLADEAERDAFLMLGQDPSPDDSN